eukprot:jgi/Ulvmu1/10340/UM061_0023.1
MSSCNVVTRGNHTRGPNNSRVRVVSESGNVSRVSEMRPLLSAGDATGCSNTRQQARRGHAFAARAVSTPVAAVTSQQDASDGPHHHFDSIPDMFYQLAQKFPNEVSLSDPHHPGSVSYTYSELYRIMLDCAAGLAALGAQHGDIIGHFADNSARWLIADQAVMLNGAANAVRGASTPPAELSSIVRSARCGAAVVQDAAVLRRLLPALRGAGGALRFVVVLWGTVEAELAAECGVPVVLFDEVVERGRESIAAEEWQPCPAMPRDSVATLVFTSGTASAPKAAALSHANILYQVETFPHFLEVAPGESALSLLPPWHIYERTVAYYLLSRGARLVYSSIPRFKADLTRQQPNYLCCVPLLLDRLHSRVLDTLGKLPALKRRLAASLLAASLAFIKARRLLQGVDVAYSLKRPSATAYLTALATFLATAVFHALARAVIFNKIRRELGVQTAVICGGGSLAPHLDDFFEALGLPVLNGWGLSETSPVLACRQVEAPGEPQRNVRGAVGAPIPGTRLKVVDPDCLEREVPDGETGVVLASGPGVMMRYWNDPAATEAAFVGPYFNTGDLGRRIPAGNLMSRQIVLTGRAKDTVVLAGGENVAPAPLEDALCRSALLEHAMVVGHDRRTLGALVCLSEAELQRRMVEGSDARDVSELTQEELNNIALGEVKRMNEARPDRCMWEVFTAAQATRKPFSVDGGTLTQTMKLKRSVVAEQYSAELEALADRIR